MRPVPRYGYGRPPHPELHRLIEAGRESYIATLRGFVEFREHLARIPLHATDAREPSWNNGWFQGIDGIALYGLVARHNPARYLEIGAGHSTRFVRRAVEDHGLRTRIVSVDPAPRADVAGLSDEVVARPVEDLDPATFAGLGAGDVLFVDGSHYCFMNTDVTVVFLEVLPRLPAGVLVHFHDVFLPWDYPPQMSERYYSEQYLLATALLFGDRLEVVLPNFLVTIDPELHEVLAPLWRGLVWSGTPTNGLSFWVRTKGGGAEGAAAQK